MYKYIFCLLLLLLMSACAPSSAYQAQESLGQASSAASCQVNQSRAESRALSEDRLQMQGDIEKIKEAEKMFDRKTGIVLSY